ncbi:MAG: hypothetical protein ABR94_12860 [Sphingobacteriales bacterium BACL12 MAG-120802-bin5]|jgi:hypothetical protein|nr:MAG: hypothetical protein ABR94_12860 [Sphingobacteriales bacterium BACL12 MAG-120802-bin5]
MNKYIYFLLIVVLSSCADRRLTDGKIKPLSPETIWEEAAAAVPAFTTLQGKARVEVQGAISQQLVADITMQTDSFIGISVRVLGLEAARMLVTPDSVKVIDRLNRQYLPRDFAYFEQQFGFPLSFDNLQDLIAGRPLLADVTMYPVVNDTRYQFRMSSSDLLNEIWLYPGFMLDRQQVKSTYPAFDITLIADDYKKTGSGSFSFFRQILVEAVENYAIDLDWASVTLDEPVDFGFTVNSRYEVVH